MEIGSILLIIKIDRNENLILFDLATSLLIIQSCTIIKPGEIGIDVKMGKVKDKVLEPGAHHFAPKVFRYVVRYETRTINHNKEFHFHSK